MLHCSKRLCHYSAFTMSVQYHHHVITCLQGHLLGIKGTFLGPVAQVAVDLSEGCDPAVLQNAPRILKELQLEEERFSATLGTGQKLLADILQVSCFPCNQTCIESMAHIICGCCWWTTWLHSITGLRAVWCLFRASQ